jgi:hypothetical protein
VGEEEASSLWIAGGHEQLPWLIFMPREDAVGFYSSHPAYCGPPDAML